MAVRATVLYPGNSYALNHVIILILNIDACASRAYRAACATQHSRAAARCHGPIDISTINPAIEQTPRTAAGICVARGSIAL